MSIITQQILEDIESLPLALQVETLDFVRFLKTKLVKSENVMKQQELNGGEVAKIMTEMAARGTAFQGIDDPISWQKEIRQDRHLPERN